MRLEKGFTKGLTHLTDFQKPASGLLRSPVHASTVPGSGFSAAGGEMKIHSVLVQITLLLALLPASRAQAEDPHSPEAVAAIWDAQPNYSETQIYALPSTTQFARKIPLTIVVLKNSRWQLSEAEAKIRRTEQIYSQCRVSFDPITIVHTVHAKGSLIDIDSFEQKGDYSFFDLEAQNQANVARKPLMFLVDKEIYDRYRGGVSFRRGLIPAGSPDEKLLDMSLLFHSFAVDERTSSGEPAKRGYYEVMAHELAHLLFNQSHLDIDDNLLSNISDSVNNTRTNQILPEQCQWISHRFDSNP